MSIHDGHRQRVRDRFLEEGLDGFNEHQVLEMLLFYCFSRKDTNELAHKLISEFGSLSRVLEAPVKELEKVPGVGKNAAVFLSFAAAFSRYYLANRVEKNVKVLTTTNEFGDYLLPFFLGRPNEAVYLLCMDAKGKVLCCKMVGEGSVNSAGIPIRKLVEIALGTNATYAVLAHNHPSGLALPSSDDINTTKQVATAFRAVDVVLVDHIVFGDDDFVSIAESGFYDPKISYITI